MSHLTRGAWIEIFLLGFMGRKGACRTSHEVRGLKFFLRRLAVRLGCRTSHEVRGLKCQSENRGYGDEQSHLTRGAWIEIIMSIISAGVFSGRTSHEVRGLKCGACRMAHRRVQVAPHTRCVD